jgi:deazaflavin-dependent oxidoreductase (nitroreductase family)
MTEDRFVAKLENRQQISITVIGRRSGRKITLPVWFVYKDAVLWLLPVHGSQTQWYRNLSVNPAITIKAGSESRALRARALKGARAVRQVIRWFGEKYTPELIARLYPGPLDVAVQMRIERTTKA